MEPPNPENFGPEGWGPERWGPEQWGPEGWGPKISRFFSPLPPPLSFFLSLSLGLLVEFWWCLKRRGPQMCTFGVLELSCEAPAALKPPGFHFPWGWMRLISTKVANEMLLGIISQSKSVPSLECLTERLFGRFFFLEQISLEQQITELTPKVWSLRGGARAWLARARGWRPESLTLHATVQRKKEDTVRTILIPSCNDVDHCNRQRNPPLL